jgi:hypothetical protein
MRIHFKDPSRAMRVAKLVRTQMAALGHDVVMRRAQDLVAAGFGYANHTELTKTCAAMPPSHWDEDVDLSVVASRRARQAGALVSAGLTRNQAERLIDVVRPSSRRPGSPASGTVPGFRPASRREILLIRGMSPVDDDRGYPHCVVTDAGWLLLNPYRLRFRTPGLETLIERLRIAPDRIRVVAQPLYDIFDERRRALAAPRVRAERTASREASAPSALIYHIRRMVDEGHQALILDAGPAEGVMTMTGEGVEGDRHRLMAETCEMMCRAGFRFAFGDEAAYPPSGPVEGPLGGLPRDIRPIPGAERMVARFTPLDGSGIGMAIYRHPADLRAT